MFGSPEPFLYTTQIQSTSKAFNDEVDAGEISRADISSLFVSSNDAPFSLKSNYYNPIAGSNIFTLTFCSKRMRKLPASGKKSNRPVIRNES